jgi:ATP-dependent protease HslVU (ClpYQ) ATPase subunit
MSSENLTVGEKFAEREAAKLAKLTAQKAGLSEEYEESIRVKKLEAKIAAETAKQLEKRNKQDAKKTENVENKRLDRNLERILNNENEFDVNNTSLPSASLEKDIDELTDKMEYINIDAANYEVTTTRMSSIENLSLIIKLPLYRKQ